MQKELNRFLHYLGIEKGYSHSYVRLRLPRLRLAMTKGVGRGQASPLRQEKS
jgi:hypothetical protein